MPTAPSYANFQILEGPFEKNKRLYVKVQNPVTKTIREVRWYPPKRDPASIDYKKILGFADGPIAIVRNVRSFADEDYLNHSKARFHVQFGWYFPSFIRQPANIPSSLSVSLCSWDEVSSNGRTIDPQLIEKTLAAHFNAEERRYVSCPSD